MTGCFHHPVSFSVSGEGAVLPEEGLHPVLLTKVWKLLAQVPLVHPPIPEPSQASQLATDAASFASQALHPVLPQRCGSRWHRYRWYTLQYQNRHKPRSHRRVVICIASTVPRFAHKGAEAAGTGTAGTPSNTRTVTSLAACHRRVVICIASTAIGIFVVFRRNFEFI